MILVTGASGTNGSELVRRLSDAKAIEVGASVAGAIVIAVASMTGIRVGQVITIGSGATYETAVVVSTNRFGATVTVAAPLTFAHPVGAQVSGTGITLTTALTQAHASTAQVAGRASTPGAPNNYSKKRQ